MHAGAIAGRPLYRKVFGGGRISRIDDNGMRTTWEKHLPSSKNAMGEISGVGDVAFIGTTLYAVIIGAGCLLGRLLFLTALLK